MKDRLKKAKSIVYSVGARGPGSTIAEEWVVRLEREVKEFQRSIFEMTEFIRQKQLMTGTKNDNELKIIALDPEKGDCHRKLKLLRNWCRSNKFLWNVSPGSHTLQ